MRGIYLLYHVLVLVLVVVSEKENSHNHPHKDGIWKKADHGHGHEEEKTDIPEEIAGILKEETDIPKEETDLAKEETDIPKEKLVLFEELSVPESKILIEEIKKSTEGMFRIFDNDEEVSAIDAVPGRIKKRQVDEQDIRQALCKDKNPGEFFRLVAGYSQCRDVVACAEEGLQAIRCPPGLAFSLKKQTCEWRQAVTDCDTKSRPKVALPQFNTKEPLCNRGELACGDGVCLPKTLFCDDKTDCIDGSDENLCGPNDPNGAEECDPTVCRLPDCYCSENGQGIPGDLQPTNVPQMVVLTFDDAINHNNFDIITSLLDGLLKNPNGCDIKATFFLSHKYTNYSMVQELYRRGHEMASHSITHNNKESYWEEADEALWRSEIGGARDIASFWANIPEEDIFGSRAPLLRLGGNRQFIGLEKAGFVYDSSMVAPLNNPPYWPYPLAFASPHRCHGNFQDCPSRAHGIMEMVMNEFDPREEPGEIDEQVSGCVMLDSCSSIHTGDNLYNVLEHNFIRHYEQNRAPMGLFLHAAWLKKSPEMLDALRFWIEQILATYNDVYFVTMKQVLAWMQQPVDSRQAAKFQGWNAVCKSTQEPDECTVSNNCALSSPALGGIKQRMQTCNACPAVFPWLDDPKGDGGVVYES